MGLYSLTFATFAVLSFAAGVSGFRHRTPVSVLVAAFMLVAFAFSLYWVWQSFTLW